MHIPSGNRIVDACAHSALPLFQEASIVNLAAEQWTTLRDTPMHTVDFPLDAMMSVVVALEDGGTGEVATIGSEGFVEVDAALNNAVAKRSSLCLFPGQVIRVSIERFQETLRTDSHFADHVYHSVRNRLFVSEQLAVCGVRHSTSKRLARWLLLASERTGLETIPQTHEQLAAALGVRRASISVDANELQRAGAIRYHRGLVNIENREILEERSCECYRVCRAAFNEETRTALQSNGARLVRS
jgi:CRP-like cAMP-binding protein